MSVMPLGELLAEVRRQPLAFLTSRRVGSLSHLLTGRDLALLHLGIPGWGDIAIAERVEEHYRESTMPWRGWVDIVEFFADDEWDAFDRFLDLACSWNDPIPAQPGSLAVPPPIAGLLDQIARRPGMFLGLKSSLRLADFLRGYLFTLSPSDDAVQIERFLARIPALCRDATGRPWFRVLRFRHGSDEDAFDEFFRLWAVEGAAR
jgi:hypothetical protein